MYTSIPLNADRKTLTNNIYNHSSLFHLEGSKKAKKNKKKHNHGVTHLDLGEVGAVHLEEEDEARDAVSGLLQLVHLDLALWRRPRQALGAERTQQQRQEQIQHLGRAINMALCFNSLFPDSRI